MLRWLASLVVGVACLLPAARAQESDFERPRISYEEQPGAPGAPQERPPALQYFFAVVAVLLVLVILCMPSRKGRLAPEE